MRGPSLEPAATTAVERQEASATTVAERQEASATAASERVPMAEEKWVMEL